MSDTSGSSLHACTHSRHLCGVWLWAFPSSSRLAAAASCLSSACPSRPPSCPLPPLEWGSTLHSWWFLKRAQVSQGGGRREEEELPQAGEITAATMEKAILFRSLFISFSLLCNTNEGKLGRSQQTKMGSRGGEEAKRRGLLQTNIFQ